MCSLLFTYVHSEWRGGWLSYYGGAGSYTPYSSDISGGAVFGTFSQNQSNTVSYNYSTTQGYTPATGSGSSYVPGYWSATSGSGSTTTPAAAASTYGGTGAYGGAYGGSGPDETLVQAGGASESFGYTKNYTIDGSGNWQVGGGTSGSGTGGASGSGWTTASYYGSTPALTDLPAFPTEAAGPSTNLLSGTDTQSGSNDTSYSFQTYAAFNGIDWSETGEKIATGSGGTTDSFSASASGLTFSPPSETGPYMNGVTVPGGSASVTGTSSTSYNYRQYAYLDDNGVWQAAATPASDVTNGVDYFGASGTTNWSLSGSGPVGTYQFGTGYVSGVYGANSGSGTTSASGSGSDTYNYQELFSYSPATNQWTPTGGSGSASGSGSATFGYSAGGDLTDTGPWGPWDEAYTGVERMMVGMGDAANDWSGTVAASGTATVSYGYSTQSNFTPGTGTGSGWTSTGTASASASGGYSTSFDAGSPFANNYSGGAGNSATLSGTVTGSGSDWGTYNYNQTNALSSDGTWSVSSGSGSTSGGASANWSYAGNDGTWSYSGDGTTLSGSVSESGGETYNLGYSGQASVSSGEWVQTGSGVGAGNASATANFSYSYSGDASGSGGGSGSYNDPLDVTLSGGNWSLAGEGTVSPSNTTTSPPTAAVYTAVIDNVVNTPEGGYVVDVPANPYDAGDPWNLPSPAGPGVVAAIMSDWVEPTGDALAGVRAGPVRAGIFAAFARYVGFFGGRHLGHGQRGRGRLRRQQLRLRDRICRGHAANALRGGEQSLVIAGVHVRDDARRGRCVRSYQRSQHGPSHGIIEHCRRGLPRRYCRDECTEHWVKRPGSIDQSGYQRG